MTKTSRKVKVITPESGLKSDSLDLKIGVPLGIFTGHSFLIVKPRETHFTSLEDGNLNPSWTKIRLSFPGEHMYREIKNRQYDFLKSAFLRVGHDALNFIEPSQHQLLGIRFPNIERINLNPYLGAPVREFDFKGGYSGMKEILQGLHEKVEMGFDLYASWIESELARNKRLEPLSK